MRRALIRFMLLFCVMQGSASRADDVLVSAGGGPQLGADQDNQQVGIDYTFYEFKRTSRTSLSLGVGYTYLKTDAQINRRIHAVTVYPELTLTPLSSSLSGYYAFVRALGPSYLSENMLGSRRQDNHFAFQAQIGVGYEFSLGDDRSLLAQLSLKHFSNANLFENNDGIDIPLVLNIGIRY
jgi:hypothetical protein